MKLTKMSTVAVLAKLKDMNVEKVEVVYDGSGDSGSIEEVAYTDSKGDSVMGVPQEVTDHIENLCYDYLLEQVGDWVNDDGGHGVVAIDVNEGSYEIRSHIREMIVHSSTYDGNIGEDLHE